MRERLGVIGPGNSLIEWCNHDRERVDAADRGLRRMTIDKYM
jgi:hypothetical protein